MVRRGYARETIWARCAIAREWLGRLDWRRATFRDVERWLAERGRGPGGTRNLVAGLRAWYRWAIREGMCEHDPTLLVDMPRLAQRLPRPARDEQIGHVLAASTPQTAALIGLMAGAGLRCVEASRLDWNDVDLRAGRIVVMGKGMKERALELAPGVMRLLAALDGIDGPVFVGVRGGRLSPARVSQIVCGAFRCQGYATVAHQLRHRFATTALRDPEADIMDVRDLLGHSSVATTQIYTKSVPGRAGKVSRALELPPAA